MFLKYKLLNTPLYIWIAFLLSSLIFILFPQIDLSFSSLFYDNGFYLKGSLYEKFFYKSVPIVVATLALFSIILFFYNTLQKKNILGVDKKTIIYIILVLALAPGLIVNTTLKENWGRARPGEIVAFGGDKEFTPAFVLSNQGGNSFSSGHGSAAFSVLGFALLARSRKKLWISLALMYGVAVSFARIIAGGHFLSDNITSFFIVYITTYALYGYFFKDDICES
ncbi:phosphatase PAP2 family protein [Sulfurimonas sp. SAG-AH-194-L11]|nr:phosphatase PAP2 family protein [Sulfurimonas sp. SAG-AH-194-L11]MDF1877818.1 phosphatase PAP2 family protein [Sulfurimonas sp. SAG-AH-194-L11]